MTKEEKKIAIAAQIINTASAVTTHLNKLPPKNTWVKKWKTRKINRRPQKKKKTAIALSKVAMDTYMCAVQIRIILSQPVPKGNSFI